MYNNESVKELSDWIRLVSGRILLFENEWIKLNTICNDRSRVVRLVNAHIWSYMIYIDDILISVLEINSVAMTYTTSTLNVMTKGNISHGN